MKVRYRRIGAFMFWGGYQLVEPVQYQSDILGYSAQGDQYTIHDDGLIEIKRWFAWDGPTNAIKTRRFVAGSLIHDVLCHAINQGWLPVEVQPMADMEMLRINETQKMPWLRRRLTYRAVRLYQSHKKKKYKEKIYEVEL